MSFPAIPDHTFPGRRMLAVKIHAIQVRMVTVTEPPGPCELSGTAGRIAVVVVTIFSGERRTTAIRKRVTSSSYKVTREKKVLHNAGRHKTRECISEKRECTSVEENKIKPPNCIKITYKAKFFLILVKTR